MKNVWNLSIIDEDGLPEDDSTHHRCWNIDTNFIVPKEDEDDESPVYYEEEKPDSSLMYGYYEESEFY